jgi:hypothetical protein
MRYCWLCNNLQKLIELEQFQAKCDQLRAEWNHGFGDATRRMVKPDQVRTLISSPKKRASTILDITCPDGEIIHEPVAADSIVKAIGKIGVEEVRNLGIWVNGVPLIASEKTNNQQKPLGNYYVMTRTDTKDKKKILQKIAEKLAIYLKVTVVPKESLKSDGVWGIAA